MGSALRPGTWAWATSMNTPRAVSSTATVPGGRRTWRSANIAQKASTANAAM